MTSSRVVLADGSEDSFDVHDVSVMWDGQPRNVYAYIADAAPLVGMLLFEDHDLSIQVRSGGRVVIQAGEQLVISSPAQPGELAWGGL